MSGDGTVFNEIGTHRLAVTVASGNGGDTACPTCPIYPGAENADGKITVAASTRYDNLASFSTYDRSWVKVSAPGENIVSAIPGGRYAVWSGTSMAAPIAAGVVALYKARYPDTSPPHFLLEQIKETSVQTTFDPLPPWGRVDLNRVDALCAVMQNTHCMAPSFKPGQFSPVKIQPE
jgi:subtilisin family serine protease